jgi:lipopolysaccharide transport system ATP-binding protein
MSDVVIKVENLSKQYRLGLVGTGTLSHDLNRWWHRIRGKEDPYLKVTEVNDRTKRRAETGNRKPEKPQVSPFTPQPSKEPQVSGLIPHPSKIPQPSKEPQVSGLSPGEFIPHPSKEPQVSGLSPGELTPHPSSDYVWALKDINFEVKQGEVLGIIGRNGAGKSTLLKILSRVTAPTTGQVKVKGRIASLLEVGTGFHPELTGRENVYLNGAIMGMTKAEVTSKLDEIVDFSGCERYIDTPVKRYSSGMRVRLGFAVAAYLEPEILIVDEVLAVGDLEFQNKCLGKMKDVAGHGRTVLFVSHNMGAVRLLCSRSILLTEGQIVLDGKSDDVVGKYMAMERTSDSVKGMVRWEEGRGCPQCSELRLNSIRLLNSIGEVASTFAVDKPVLIEVTYHVRILLRGMRVEFHLLAEDGTIAFVSVDQDQRPNVLKPGHYRSVLTIPGKLLNRRQYTVSLQFAIPRVRVLIPGQEYMSFNCVMGDIQGSYISSHWPGVVSPELFWSFEELVI